LLLEKSNRAKKIKTAATKNLERKVFERKSNNLIDYFARKNEE